MRHDAEGGEDDASDLSFSVFPSPPTLAAPLSPACIPVTLARAWGRTKTQQGQTRQNGAGGTSRVVQGMERE